jgi:hypothetical protein
MTEEEANRIVSGELSFFGMDVSALEINIIPK